MKRKRNEMESRPKKKNEIKEQENGEGAWWLRRYMYSVVLAALHPDVAQQQRSPKYVQQWRRSRMRRIDA